MDNIKNIVGGGIITLIIGGGAYTFSQQDVVNNFAEDTGMSREKAQEYVESIPEEDFATWEEIGLEEIEAGELSLEIANDIDCINYEYEWESLLLPCTEGKVQILKIGNSEVALGKAYIKLNSEDATKEDIQKVIDLIDDANSNYRFEIMKVLVPVAIIDEMINTNFYNKSILKSALESE